MVSGEEDSTKGERKAREKMPLNFSVFFMLLLSMTCVLASRRSPSIQHKSVRTPLASDILEGTITNYIATETMDESSPSNLAVYLSPDGSLLDSSLSPVAGNLVLPTMPNPADFVEYEDFEQALIDWKDMIGGLQLPRIFGRTFSRPPIDVVPEMGQVLPWDAVLVPSEPRPEFFATYDEYLAALDKWEAACCEIPDLPCHASIYATSLNLPLLKVEKSHKEDEVKTHTRDDVVLAPAIESLNLWETLPEESKQAMRASVNKVAANMKKTQQKFGCLVPPITPVTLNPIGKAKPPEEKWDLSGGGDMTIPTFADPDPVLTGDIVAYIQKCFFPAPIDRFLADCFACRLYPRPTNYTEILLSIASVLNTMLSLLLQGVAHKSRDISAVCVYALGSLMEINDRSIKTTLRADKSKLYHTLRSISFSKFSHVQKGVAKIFKLFEDRDWQDYIITYYIDLAALYDDMSSHKHGATCPSILHKFLVAFFGEVVDRASPSTVGQMVTIVQNKHELFHWLLDQVIGEEAKEPSHPYTVLVSKLLCTFAKHFSRLNLVGNMSHKSKTKPPTPTEYLLRLEKKDLSRILDFIVATPIKPDTNYPTRTNMLGCLRYLLKSHGLMEYFIDEPLLMSKVNTFCREMNEPFNTVAWKIFKQTLIYHKGSVVHMINTKQLERFLSVAGPGVTPYILRNAMRAINKYLAVPISNNRKYTDQLKSDVVKDQKKFCKYYVEKNLFIKMHMIYKKYADRIAVAGAAFQQLACFYRLLYTNETANIILREVIKEEDYRVGLSKVNSMFDT